MLKRIKINQCLAMAESPGEITLYGWVRTRRDAKDFSFIELNDGSCLANIQVIADGNMPGYDAVSSLTTGSAIRVTGEMVPSPGKGQAWEIRAADILVYDKAPEDYPLQKKRHSDEFLRGIAHLRPRTNKFGAAFRIRSQMALAVHQYFRDHGFQYIQTPIITGSDCEGAGEMFRVTALKDGPEVKEGNADFSGDFFGKETNLTVSGQLSAEMFALALGDVYTFGPTFRAENSNTSRHAAEFWMIEPEMAFCDIHGNMDLAEDCLKYLIRFVMENCADDINLFAKFVDKTLSDTLNNILDNDFIRLTYTDAIEILKSASKKFEYPVEFGLDLQSEHERFLAEEHFKKPVILYNYPKTIKPFYMRVNDDGITVAAMDVLVPRIGEIIGGSQREERLAVLESRMASMDMDPEEYWWYLDSRRYGSVPHSGFGLGFERLLMLVTGITNIRDVIPFPRTVGNIEF